MNATGGFYTDSFGDHRVLSKKNMMYDLFFIDMTEADTDGLTFALELAGSGVSVPIVLCSSKINYPDRAAVLSSSPDNLYFLDKPIKTAELSSMLDMAVSLVSARIPTIELRPENDTLYVTEDDIAYALSKGRYVHVFLKDGREIPLLTSMYNFYDEVAMFSHMVLLGEHSLFNIVYLDRFSPFKVVLQDGTELKSSPLSLKYIREALRLYQEETL
jgi:CheY-like chemotaxis protein